MGPHDSEGWQRYVEQRRAGDLAELTDHWGEAYEIGCDREFWAKRRDTGKVIRRADASDMFAEIRADYSEHPVPRDVVTDL